MESILQYSDSDDDREQDLDLAADGTKPSQLLLAKPSRTTCINSDYKPESDYFGLNSSDDDDLCAIGETQSSDGSQTTLPIDTLINSYQLENEPIGPKSEVIEPTETSQRKRFKSLNVRNETGKVAECEDRKGDSGRLIVPSDTPNLEFFQPHVRIVDIMDEPPRSSKLPKRRLRRLKGHTGVVLTLHWASPKNHSHLLLSSSMDGSIKIWDVFAEKSQCIWTRNVAGVAVTCAQWSPDGVSIASGGYEKVARIYDVYQGCETAKYRHKHFVHCLKFHPMINNVFVTGSFGRIECWDTRGDATKPVKSFEANFDEVQDIEFLSAGNQLLSCSNLVSRDSPDRSIMCWDFRTGAVLSNQIFHERYHCTCLRVHPSGSYFVAQTNGNYVALFSTTRPYKHNKFKRYEGHKVEGFKIGCSFSTDGRFLYSGSSDGQLYVYDFKTWLLIKNYYLSDLSTLSVECHPVLPSAVAVSDWRGNIFLYE